ncbi:Electron transfer flavoprotein-ubiquinone oxidoreductase [Candidatus Kinetoplastibacterium sorsogonicusi]|uniref:Electron transfer flavoprotein-ubiquinone oxidoreductase n=1 Tax=Candidatus Kinetoplastidibacterium kentomonadis TaxID=1576550 RepID=A0A3Q8EX25_9PROT|nr:electron-transfer flavoprotein:ubiquinone oxidoreductase [Candidatus Kinetoplastibacterium sorsogonicusi]AWD32546.1 Electron transfer flavoprotein-ubiquinone oxidoreductase [Candidatus Kinetoplastibacterium sorsogonicusi]
MLKSEQIKYDILIVGGGPAGLSAAIRLKQISLEKKIDLSVCILEKGVEIGAHILSGALLETRGIDMLIPQWKKYGAPIESIVTKDEFFYLNQKNAFKINNFFIPNSLKNKECYLIKLTHFTKWMAQYAENLGVDIFSSFAAKDLIIDDNRVKGIKVEGINNTIEILAKYSILSEGSRGHLGKKVIKYFNLDENSDPQSYSIGIKELWEISPKNSQAGHVIHTFGWPLNYNTYGGSFIYHMSNNQLSIGTIIGLDYKNPWLSPFEEFQNFKKHPFIKNILKNGKRISYGAKSITSGGLFSLPKLTFKGGILIGCNAGLLNNAKMKGINSAIESGQMVAESIFSKLQLKSIDINKEIHSIFINSDLYKDLYKARNYRNWFSKGTILAIIMNFIEQKILNGFFIWNIHKKISDHLFTQNKNKYKNIKYPIHDNKTTFDIESSIYLSNIKYDKNQKNHLIVHNIIDNTKINNEKYGQLETRYCPAGVYKYENKNNNIILKISPENCIHCKTCDIKDPQQNIEWSPPNGGSGPIYNDM